MQLLGGGWWLWHVRNLLVDDALAGPPDRLSGRSVACRALDEFSIARVSAVSLNGVLLTADHHIFDPVTCRCVE